MRTTLTPRLVVGSKPKRTTCLPAKSHIVYTIYISRYYICLVLEPPPTPYESIDQAPRMDPVWYDIFYSTVGAAAARAFSDKTDRSIVTPKHEIRLHLERSRHIRHPEQAAEHNPKNVKIKVLLSLTKVLKSHISL